MFIVEEVEYSPKKKVKLQYIESGMRKLTNEKICIFCNKYYVIDLVQHMQEDHAKQYDSLIEGNVIIEPLPQQFELKLSVDIDERYLLIESQPLLSIISKSENDLTITEAFWIVDGFIVVKLINDKITIKSGSKFTFQVDNKYFQHIKNTFVLVIIFEENNNECFEYHHIICDNLVPAYIHGTREKVKSQSRLYNGEQTKKRSLPFFHVNTSFIDIMNEDFSEIIGTDEILDERTMQYKQTLMSMKLEGYSLNEYNYQNCFRTLLMLEDCFNDSIIKKFKIIMLVMPNEVKKSMSVDVSSDFEIASLITESDWVILTKIATPKTRRETITCRIIEIKELVVTFKSQNNIAAGFYKVQFKKDRKSMQLQLDAVESIEHQVIATLLFPKVVSSNCRKM